MTTPNPNGYLSLSDIAATQDLHVEVVEVEEWGGCVGIRQMTTDEMTRFYQENFDNKAGTMTPTDRQFLTKLLATTLVDEDGELVFKNIDEGVGVLKAKSFAVVNRLALISVQMNALSEEEVEEEKKD